MKGWIRRIRGAIGMGLTWAVGWMPVGVLVGGAAWLAVFNGMGLPLGGAMKNFAIMFGVMGFVGGGLFSTLLRIADGRRRFDELSTPRFAAWGAIGGGILGALGVSLGFLGLGGVSAVTVGITAFVGLLGAGSAAGTLALARQADDQELLEAGEGVGDVGLTASEADQLLGPGRS